MKIKLPSLLERKLYKTGQTRGADDDVIYQNRVLRNSMALFPYNIWDSIVSEVPDFSFFEKGYVVLISPSVYFENKEYINNVQQLKLGENALLFYQTREEWENLNPLSKNFQVATSRTPNSLGGQYVARIAATTGDAGERINRGFTERTNKGLGIRGYEYATTQTLNACRLQLECLYWLCEDSSDVSRQNGMSLHDINVRRNKVFSDAENENLLDFEKLYEMRMINSQRKTVCPLCLQELSAASFLCRLQQAPGREVHDLTVTEVNLFHIKEVRYGEFNHRPYNLGWGHHHCNVVVKDSGIFETLNWMKTVIARNNRS